MNSTTFPNTLRIVVTREDIRKGVKCSSGRCPIALALMRDFGPSYHYIVASKDLCLTQGLHTVTYALTRKAKAFLSAFDGDENPSPITFVAQRLR